MAPDEPIDGKDGQTGEENGLQEPQRPDQDGIISGGHFPDGTSMTGSEKEIQRTDDQDRQEQLEELPAQVLPKGVPLEGVLEKEAADDHEKRHVEGIDGTVEQRFLRKGGMPEDNEQHRDAAQNIPIQVSIVVGLHLLFLNYVMA